jgi:hypothetical protein
LSQGTEEKHERTSVKVVGVTPRFDINGSIKDAPFFFLVREELFSRWTLYHGLSRCGTDYDKFYLAYFTILFQYLNYGVEC